MFHLSGSDRLRSSAPGDTIPGISANRQHVVSLRSATAAYRILQGPVTLPSCRSELRVPPKISEGVRILGISLAPHGCLLALADRPTRPSRHGEVKPWRIQQSLAPPLSPPFAQIPPIVGFVPPDAEARQSLCISFSLDIPPVRTATLVERWWTAPSMPLGGSSIRTADAAEAGHRR